MISRQTVKENAKLQLGNNIFSNNWLMALLILLIQSLLLGITGTFGGIIAILIAGPFAFSITGIFMSLIRGKDAIYLEDMFSGFNVILGRNILLSFLSGLFILLWSFLFVIPGIVKHYSYSMAFYIANDHPEYDWRACLDESRRLTRGHKMDLFILDLSFIGWYIVGALCFGIGTLWVAPYHYAAKVNYFDAIMNLD